MRLVGLALLGWFLALAGEAHAVRVKDLASVKGVRENQVIGYGLVIGLNGTGDRRRTEFTVRSLASLLAKMGIGVDAEQIDAKNVAAVMATATFPPFARNGSQLDVVVSSLGDAKSLEGGTLLLTPLFGADGEVYAIAQGPLSVGGFSAGGGGGSSVQKNHPTVGRIVEGATVERELTYRIDERREIELALRQADFTTARRTAAAINQHFGAALAEARDAGTLGIRLPEDAAGGVVGFVAELESVEVQPDRTARVVLNERTGTVVMGADVRIATVAVAHGNLSVTVSATTEVSQPAPFAERGDTVVFQNREVEAVEEGGQINVVPGPVTISELVQGLNAMGVTPRDLIAILQAIKASGAMTADLELL